MDSNYPLLGPETVTCVMLGMLFTCNADSSWAVLAFKTRSLVIHFSRRADTNVTWNLPELIRNHFLIPDVQLFHLYEDL